MNSATRKDFPLYRIYENGDIVNTKLGRAITHVVKKTGYAISRAADGSTCKHIGGVK